MSAAVLGSPAPSRVDRIFFSRTWRLAGAGMLLALLGVDRWAGDWRPVAGSVPEPQAASETEVVAALSGETGLSPEQMRWLLARVEFVSLTAQESRGTAEQALQ